MIAGYFENNTNLGVNDALEAINTGLGNALHAVNTQVQGRAAFFETGSNPSSSSPTTETAAHGSGPALLATNDGTGPAAVFVGDVQLTGSATGIVLTASDGPSCYRLTVNSGGQLTTAPVTCPVVASDISAVSRSAALNDPPSALEQGLAVQPGRRAPLHN